MYFKVSGCECSTCVNNYPVPVQVDGDDLVLDILDFIATTQDRQVSNQFPSIEDVQNSFVPAQRCLVYGQYLSPIEAVDRTSLSDRHKRGPALHEQVHAAQAYNQSAKNGCYSEGLHVGALVFTKDVAQPLAEFALGRAIALKAALSR
jgi:hypothetical protein